MKRIYNLKKDGKDKRDFIIKFKKIFKFSFNIIICSPALM